MHILTSKQRVTGKGVGLVEDSLLKQARQSGNWPKYIQSLLAEDLLWHHPGCLSFEPK